MSTLYSSAAPLLSTEPRDVGPVHFVGALSSSISMACLFTNPAKAEELAKWVSEHLPTFRFDICDSPADIRVGSPDTSHQVLLLDRHSALSMRPQLDAAAPQRRPEVLLFGVPPCELFRLRKGGLSLAINLPSEFVDDGVGHFLRHTLCTRLRMRALSAQLVGNLDLSEALRLVRYYMLAEALDQGKSRRHAAELLGITRQAVQHMLKNVDGIQPTGHQSSVSHRAPRE